MNGGLFNVFRPSIKTTAQKIVNEKRPPPTAKRTQPPEQQPSLTHSARTKNDDDQ